MRRLIRCLASFATAAMMLGAAPAIAQNPFSAAVEINDRAVTYYEIDQRVLLFEVLNAPGDLRQRAIESLVDERLQVVAAQREGVVLDPADLDAGIQEFAGRADLTPEQLFEALGQVGIDPGTLRDFIRNQLLWRDLIRARFGPLGEVTEDEIEDALLFRPGQDAELTVVLAEIFLALTPQNQIETRALANRLSQELDGDIAGFSAAARQYSAAPSRSNNGVLPARSLSEIPPGLRALILPLAPGDTTDPIPVGPALAIFQMRSLTEGAYGGPEVAALDYATVAFPGGRTGSALGEAARLTASVDNCDDLYGAFPGGFERQSQAPEAIPEDIATELLRLDAGEVSTNLVRPGADGGEALIWVMLCERQVDVADGAEDQLQAGLRQERLVAYADQYLAELRADAIITYAEGL